MSKTTASIDTGQFKRMNAGGVAEASSSNTDRCAIFKPLYRNEVNKAPSDPSNDPEAVLQAAYQNGFQKGIEHGCQEALGMAKTSLAPGLTAFMESYKNLLDQSELSKSTASHNAIELALLITEKIIDQTTVELDHDLSELKETITEALMETNRLSLNVNPDDLSELESMLSQDGFDATSHPQVSIVKNNAIQPGELLIEVQSEALDAVDQKILDKLSQILAKTAAVD